MSTPLLTLLRDMSDDQRGELAAKSKTSVNYLYQIATCRRTPRAQMANRMAKATEDMAQIHGQAHWVLSVPVILSMCAIGRGDD